MTVIGRSEAIGLGMSTYFTGLPCKQNHVCRRQTANTRCLDCAKEWVRANKEKRRASVAAWRSANPEADKLATLRWRSNNIDRVRSQKRAWAKRNPDKAAAAVRSWHDRHRDRVNKNIAVWSRNNPEAVLAGVHRRRARLRGLGGSYAAGDIRSIGTSQRWRCAGCKIQLDEKVRRSYHVDHILPLALNGKNVRSNLQILCVSCNLSKGARHPVLWAQSRGFLL
jgi:5-methylcytosine-specific restriction endonuclease McrA